MDMKDKNFVEDFKEYARRVHGKEAETLSIREAYEALCQMLISVSRRKRSEDVKVSFERKDKEIYYFSMEFLIGRLLKEYLVNFGILDKVRDGLHQLGFNLDEVLEQEADPGLGNGGLGRLAACFMDSLASLGINAMGMGLRYRFGLFRQKIVDGEQIELPDNWLLDAYPWEDRRSDRVQMVKLGGIVDREWVDGNFKFHYRDYREVRAVPYDIPIVGYGVDHVNTLRLWYATPKDEKFDLDAFNNGDYSKAVKHRNEIEAITTILYPDDRNAVGKRLRLEQEYVLVSAGIQDIVRRFLKGYGENSWDLFPEKVAIHINDTHPTMCIPELIRVLIDEHDVPWNKAYEITTKTIAYTNHTVMPEALERWPIDLMQRVVPRIYMIIDEINRRFFEKLDTEAGHQVPRTVNNSILYEGMVNMPVLSVICSHHVNGVASIHSEIIKKETLNDLYKLMPDKFCNKTNGISHRRFLLSANESLTNLLNGVIGSDFKRDAMQLEKLMEFKDNSVVLNDLSKVKYQNKINLAKYIKEHNGIDVDPNSIFDVQVKRIHAYKRQLLFMFKILNTYNGLKNGTIKDIHPMTYVMAGKAAGSYAFAKKSIKLYNTIADLINNDPSVKDIMKVVFIENFCVSNGEIIYPAADISEQISLAGKEASGTGNMKFMFNGAVTLGTMDGANVEIYNLVGEDNIKIFGLRENEVPEVRKAGYFPAKIADEDRRLYDIREELVTKIIPTNKVDFFDIYDELFKYGDQYMVIKDFDDYIRKSDELVDIYKNDRMRYNRMSLINIAKAGFFSSDRTIREYYDEIWK
ncbi:MAG: glycogen/starch/alpha-glucan phosphorylase [Lachnospiraceae bacterium]|nr:glycogen/starch/alpha-glucan phosphorylase [Lachnospiraceae bacterium]